MMQTRQADEKVKPSRLDPPFFERLFEGAGLAIYVMDRAGFVRAYNSIGATLLQSANLDAPNCNIRALIPEKDQTAYDDALAGVIQHLTPQEFRTRLPGASGESSEYAVWLTPIYGEDGGLATITVWFHDLTARLAMRRNLRRRERLTTLGSLSGAVAHHYNNLLCSIATSIEYAMNMSTIGAMKRVLTRTADAVSRAGALNRQLLSFAQSDLAVRHTSDLTEAVLFYCDEHEKALHERGIQLAVEWERMPPFEICREHVETIMGNLVGNAIDVLPEGGEIRVRLAPHGDHAVSLTVTDNGPGIRPEHLDRVFDPFFTTKGVLASGPSTQPGMGLSEVYGIVAEMNGTITASNLPTGGAKFEVILPFPSACAS